VKCLRIIIFFLFVLLSLPVIGFAQSSDQTPQFRSQTNLVLVPVQVRNKGQHVEGLKQDAFTLLQDGKEQKISVFEEIRTTTERLRRAQVGPNQFTNELVGNPQSARYVILAIDRINTTTMDMHRLRDGLLKFLSQVADTGEPVRLISIELNGMHMLQDFTTDPKLIATALQRYTNPTKMEENARTNDNLHELEVAASGSYQNDPEALASFLKTLDRIKDAEQTQIDFQQRGARTNSLESLQQLAISLTGLPGRKSLVWASSGYPFSSIVREGRTSVTYDFGHVLEATALDRYTTQLLNAANIAVYPVDARGTVNTAYAAMDPTVKYMPTDAAKESINESNQDVIATFQRLAMATGGTACVERTDLSGCFKDALDDSRDYYMLGFYLDPKSTKDGWHKLQVKLDEKGASVRSRNGYLFPLPDPEKTRDLDIGASINSLLLEAGLPFFGEWLSQDPKGAKKSVHFRIHINPEATFVSAQNNKLNLEFVGVARAKDGSIAAKFGQKIDRTLPPEGVSSIQRGGISYTNVFDLAPGDYLVRFIVRDNLTGRIGGVSTMLKVQ
jgi:VWFA-related protein